MAKETNEELNLTPFIGLFAMLVVLLLVTAVWNTVEVLGTNSSNAPSSAVAPASPPPPQDNKPKVELALTVLVDKVQISVNSKPVDFPLLAGSEIDKDRITQYMKTLKDLYPEKKDITLYTDNRTPYRHMIESFDLLVGADFPDVGVSTQ